MWKRAAITTSTNIARLKQGGTMKKFYLFIMTVSSFSFLMGDYRTYQCVVGNYSKGTKEKDLKNKGVNVEICSEQRREKSKLGWRALGLADKYSDDRITLLNKCSHACSNRKEGFNANARGLTAFLDGIAEFNAKDGSDLFYNFD